MNRCFKSLSLVSVFLAPLISYSASTAAKPVVLYSRYYNAKGEDRYTPEGTYRQAVAHLRKTCEVRVGTNAPSAPSLRGVDLIIIANPSDQPFSNNPAPPHFSKADIKVLTDFVREGGGLILMGNQENHNLEVEDTNRLLGHFGLQWTNLYTDAKKLVIRQKDHLFQGLTWAYYTGNSVLIDPDHPAKPRALVENDLTQKPIKGDRDQPGALMASADLGKGRVVVITDAGWLTNMALNDEGIGGVTIKGHNNLEILDRLVRWTARRE